MKLDEIPKKNIYEVPANYFDKLPGVVMARVTDKKQGFIFSASAFAWHNPWLKGALASLALIICFVFVFLVKSAQVTDHNQPIASQPSESSNLLASVSKTDAMEYLLTSEQINHTDLALLSQTDQDITHEFIQASSADILREVEKVDEAELADLNSITFN